MSINQKSISKGIFWKPISRRDRRDFPSLLWRSKRRYRFHWIPQNINSRTHHVFEIHFNIVPYLQLIPSNAIIITGTNYITITSTCLFPTMHFFTPQIFQSEKTEFPYTALLFRAGVGQTV